jgi:SAM-dependent methyltransferase
MSNTRPGLWGSGHAYEKYMGRWSRRIAPMFLDWLSAAPGEAWLDIGCGTGALSAAILRQCQPVRVAGVDPAQAFLDGARTEIGDARFAAHLGSAEALPFADAEFGCTVSGLVLNFADDADKAATEMIRVTRPGGLVGLYVWDYAGHMQIMRAFFDAATELDARAREFDDGVKAPNCRPSPLRELFIGNGLADVEVDALDIATAFESFDDYWTPFLGGTGSAPKYLASLDTDAHSELREIVRDRLPTGPDGEILLAVRAWAVRGRRPA